MELAQLREQPLRSWRADSKSEMRRLVVPTSAPA